MRYYLDTEFNEFGGELLSLALVGEGGQLLYLIVPEPVAPLGAWVAENVWPIRDHPSAHVCPLEEWPHAISRFLGGGPAIIVADWPDDIRYFCEAIITGPGQMVALDNITFELKRVDAYPTSIAGAVQHNALWDAMALRAKHQGL